MNTFQVAFCRVFQSVFRLALPFLPYREPQRMESIQELPALLERLHVSCVLLVTDAPLRQCGVTAPLEALLARSGVRCAVYDGTCANPTTKNVEEARALYLREGCQGLIAMGGGSSMDCAKAVGARIVYPNRTLNQLEGILRVLRRIPPLIAIPTTAGTGSEVTLAAVITDSKTRHKYPINSFPLIPSYAVLDPKVTFTLPPSLTATTGMDALTHAVEAYIGRSTTRQTRALALEATHLIFAYIETAYRDGRNPEARAGMLQAAYKAGSAFSRSYVGYIHAVAHSLGGRYNIPHGLANAVLMPIVLRHYGSAAHKKLHELGVAAGVASENDTHASGAEKFISAIEAMNRRMRIPSTLSGIREEDIPAMARNAAHEANPLYPVPVEMDAKELEIFYRQVSDGSEMHA